MNAINGCTRISPGCGGPGLHGGCYAELLAGTRLRNHPSRVGLTKQTSAGPRWTGEVRFIESELVKPLAWRRPRMIFWNAHGDMFHDSVPDAWIDRCFAVMALTPQHIHQLLTKRSARMRAYLSDQDLNDRISAALGNMLDGGWVWQEGKRFRSKIENMISVFLGHDTDDEGDVVHFEDPMPLPNVWLGVSTEDQTRADERIPDLLATPAAVRWVSAEPLLGPIDFRNMPPVESYADKPLLRLDALTGRHQCGPAVFGDDDMPRVDWIVVGGESGPRARPMHPQWARDIRDQCAAAGVPFFFKQWGEWVPISAWPDTEEASNVLYYPAPISRPEARRRPKVESCVLQLDGSRLDAYPVGAMTMFAVGKGRAGRTLDGRTHDAMPALPEARAA